MTKAAESVTADTPPIAMPAGANAPFERLAEPFRRALKLHCYRMLGSMHEADDVVQETFLRAWRSYGKFEGRGSFRAWLYRIATNVCFDALAARKETRGVPQALPSAAIPEPDGVSAAHPAWLEPYPDFLLEGIADDAPGPEARYASREAVSLAFITVIQQVPPRQRAALLLCDVLGWSAAEAADALGVSVAAVNSALQRARETLARHFPHGRPPAPLLTPTEEQRLQAYVQTWERLDLDGFVALLKEDALYTMPPLPQRYAGRRAIEGFFESAWRSYGGFRLLRTSANGQPAFGAYARTGADADWAAHSIHVLTFEHGAISALTLFVKPTGPRLFQAFGLPLHLSPS